MSLYRQLLIFTLTLCFVLFVGVWVDKLKSTRSFLVDQLESHAQDTATSLGLSLSPFVAQSDFATIDAMLNAIFDRGYYRTIALEDVNGKQISERHIPVVIEHVPAWFIKLIPLETPGAQAFIMDGWKRAGSIYVESHPGYAYQTLWKTAVIITIYFFLIGFVVLILGGIGLRILLKPLRKVESQAEALCRKEYEIQDPVPRTRELRRVVLTMNRMTQKVKEMFEEQSVIAEKLRQNAYGDSLTGLGNRRFMMAQVKAIMDAGGEFCKGSFLLVHIHNLEKINVSGGYAAGDELLQKAARILTDPAIQLTGQITARLNGGDFAVFLPDIDCEDSEKQAAKITTELSRLAVEKLSSSDHICSLGGIFYTTPLSFEQMIAEADMALSSARQSGPNRWFFREVTAAEGTDTVRGKTWWQETLARALSRKSLIFYGQSVVSSSNEKEIIHHELFSRVVLDDGQVVPAGIFIPLAERSDLVSDLDRQITALAIRNHKAITHKAIAINLSAGTLADETFMDWLIYKLENLRNTGTRIFFEFAEFNAVQHLERVKVFSGRIRTLGFGIGLDHFGRSFSNFGYLKSLKPDYVKIDAAYTREIESKQSDAYFFIGALTSVAHSLDITVIAEGVENEEQLRLLKDQNIDGLQGYLISRPTPLTIE